MASAAGGGDGRRHDRAAGRAGAPAAGPRRDRLRPHRAALPQLRSDRGARRAATRSTVDAARSWTARRKYGPFDLIFEATGASPVVFESMRALGKNGVLVLSSVTGGDKMIEVPADRINLEFVLGNKVMVGTVNANREYFELGVRDMAQAEAAVSRLARPTAHPSGPGAGELAAAAGHPDRRRREPSRSTAKSHQLGTCSIYGRRGSELRPERTRAARGMAPTGTRILFRYPAGALGASGFQSPTGCSRAGYSGGTCWPFGGGS